MLYNKKVIAFAITFFHILPLTSKGESYEILF